MKSSRLATKRIQARKHDAAFDPKTFLAEEGPGRTIHQYQKNEVIFRQRTRADAVYYVRRGRVRLSMVVSRHRKEATIAMFGMGDFLGVGCIADDQPRRMATATALTDCSVLRIEKNEMRRVLHKERAFSDLFVSYLLARNRRTQEDLVDQLFSSSEKRLARTLLLLAQLHSPGFGKEGRSEVVVVPRVSQQTLAEMIGATRQRVNFLMNRFRRLGFVDSDGGLRVHSSLLGVILRD